MKFVDFLSAFAKDINLNQQLCHRNWRATLCFNLLIIKSHKINAVKHLCGFDILLLGIMCCIVVLNHHQVLMQLDDIHDIIHSPAFCLL